MFVRDKMKSGALAVALAFAATSFPAHAVLERVGPVSSNPALGNYPSWYQDTTGIGLEFCAPMNEAEVDGGWCLLLPGDVVAPEVFPTNFFDEHFYFAASAQIGTRQAGGKAILVLAEEAAFAVGPPIPGDQITFSRIRVVLNPVPADGVYRFIHPYGEESIFALAGDRIFFTDDVGVGCGGSFECSLTSRLGPFLLPSAAPGGAEMPPLTEANQVPDTNPAHFGGVLAPTPYPFNGKSYVADPARIGPVTGSPLPNFTDSSGNLRNHNIFRIEGPAGSGLGLAADGVTPVDFLETTDFNLMGRLYTGVMPGRVEVERASYSESSTAKKLDVFATAVPTTQGRLPAAARPAPLASSSLSFFDRPCSGVSDGLGGVRAPYGVPSGAVETPLAASGNRQWAQTQPASTPKQVCIKDSSARDANGNQVAVYFPAVVTDEVSVTPAFYDPIAGTLAVNATSSDTVADLTLTMAYAQYQGTMSNGQITVSNLLAPPADVFVQSSALGVTKFQVSTGFAAGAPAALPVASNDAWTFPMNTAMPLTARTLAVLANDSNAAGGTVTLTSAPTLGVASVNPDGTVSYTPNLYASGADAFTYTVTVGSNVSNAGLATLNLTPVNVAPVANNDAYNAVTGTLLSLNVLANDTDPNGAANIVGPVIVTPPGAGATAVVNGKNINFTATAAGTYTFTYVARDAGVPGFASLDSNLATVTVQATAAETLAITLSQYIRNKNRLRVTGTVTPAAGQTVKVEFVNAAGTVLGTAGTVTSVAGAWTLDTVIPLPAGTVSVKATTSNGTVQATALQLK